MSCSHDHRMESIRAASHPGGVGLSQGLGTPKNELPLCREEAKVCVWGETLGFLRGPDKKNWTHYQEIFEKGKAVFIAWTDTTP